MPHALVLAGGSDEGPLERELQLPSKAFAPIGEAPMLTYVLAALASSSSVSGCILVGPESALQELADGTPDLPDVQVVGQAKSLFDNLERGLAAVPTEQEWILIVTADIPLIQGHMIDDLMEACPPEAGEVFYPIVQRTLCEERYPLTRRTYVRLREGTFTGGNVFLARRDALKAALALAREAVAARKKPWRLGMMLGPVFVLKWLFRTLSIEDVENRVSGLVGYRCRAVPFHHPEIAVDVDKPDDLQLVRAALA